MVEIRGKSTLYLCWIFIFFFCSSYPLKGRFLVGCVGGLEYMVNKYDITSMLEKRCGCGCECVCRCPCEDDEHVCFK